MRRSSIGRGPARVLIVALVGLLALLLGGTVRAATFTVTTSADELDTPSGAAVSLREALRDAAALAGADTIDFAPALSGQTINLTLGTLQTTDADGATVDASSLPSGLTIVGPGADRVFDNVGTLTLEGVTLTGGFLAVCCGGAAIYNHGPSLTISRCTLTGNNAGYGAAVFTEIGSTTTIVQSTFSGNSAIEGAAIYNRGTTILNHSTVAGNVASAAGGGIYNLPGYTLTLENGIAGGNTGAPGADVYNGGTLDLAGTNIVQDLVQAGSQTGAGSILAVAPALGPLANNGGPTLTMLPNGGSPAIDAATGSAITSDQRGYYVSGTPDIGAAEYQGADPVPTRYWFGVDVPAPLSGAIRTRNQVVRSDLGTYSVATTMSPAVQVAALELQGNGSWLFAPARAFTAGAATYQARDLVSFDGSAYSLALSGATAGIPAYARIDAVFLLNDGDYVLSFDVPVNLGGTEYSRSDLVRYDGGTGFSLYKAAQLSGIPASSNLVAAARDPSGELIVAFDVPTRVAATDYLPGELVLWSGTSLSSHLQPAGWPAGTRLDGLAFSPSATAVPDGGAVPGTALSATKAAGSDILLTWAAPCSPPGGADYEIYEGTLGSFYSHATRTCSTSGATTATLTPSPGNTYYIVVPTTAYLEGSYGRDSAGLERPPGAPFCRTQSIATCP